MQYFTSVNVLNPQVMEVHLLGYFDIVLVQSLSGLKVIRGGSAFVCIQVSVHLKVSSSCIMRAFHE